MPDLFLHIKYLCLDVSFELCLLLLHFLLDSKPKTTLLLLNLRFDLLHESVLRDFHRFLNFFLNADCCLTDFAFYDSAKFSLDFFNLLLDSFLQLELCLAHQLVELVS